MIKRLFAQSPQSLLLLLYFGLMPSLFGSFLAGLCLSHSETILSLDFFSLFAYNFLFAFVLGLGFMPTTFYSLLAGYFFGWFSLPYLVFSYCLASAFGYWLCGKMDKGGLLKLFGEKYPIDAILQKLSDSGIMLSALCRMSPTLPFAVLNCFFALVRFPFLKYMIGSMLGMIPRTVFAVYIGGKFTNVHSVADLHSDFSTWFALALAVISFLGIGWIVKKKLF